jgi:hypothetical protein
MESLWKLVKFKITRTAYQNIKLNFKLSYTIWGRICKIFFYIAAKWIEIYLNSVSQKYFVQPYLEVAKPVSLNFHGDKGEEMIAMGEVGDVDALTIREVHCCKSSEWFGLKCKFSLASNKYIPCIGLV